MSKSNVVELKSVKRDSSALPERVSIEAPKFDVLNVTIEGTAPFVQHRFYKKAELMLGMEEGDAVKKKRSKNRKGRDYKQEYEDAQYKMKGNKNGIPAASFRRAMISACRSVDFKMTQAKQSIFMEADGFDIRDGIPLIGFTKGKPHVHEAAVRNANGRMDIRVRPMWDEGWEVRLRVRYDALIFTATDIANLLQRAGISVGVGEGRPASKDSAGCGWGTFSIKGKGFK